MSKKARPKKQIVVEQAMSQEEKYQVLWGMLVILLLAVLIYSNALRNGFIYFDDPELVTDNYFIRQITWENLGHFFTTPVQFTYLPMGLISYAIDYQIGQLDPFIYHLDSLIVHLLTIVMVYWVFFLLTRKWRMALFIACLFAIHPTNVDTVDWVATRNNLLTAFFYLAALMFYSLYLKKNFQLWYLALSCIAFTLSALSKSSSVVLPIALFLWDYYDGRKWSARLLLEKIPYVVIALIFGIVTLNIRADVVPPVNYNIFDRIILFCYSLTDYLVRLLFPLQLSMSYAYPAKDANGLLPLHLYLAPFILALIVWGLFKLNLTKKVLIVGLLFFVVNIFLSQSVMLIDNFMASRYAYLSYIGLFFILADINERVLDAPAEGWKSKLKIAWVGLLIVFVAGFSVLTYSRNFVWKDTISLFDDVVQKQPNIPWVYSNRGLAKYKANDLTGALSDFNHSLQLDPNFALSLYYRGVISHTSGDNNAALADLNHVVSLIPEFAMAYNDRAKVKLATQDSQGALDDYNQAIQRNPSFVDAYYNRGSLKNDLGDYQGAVADFDMVISLYPEYSGSVYYLRGVAKWNLNDQAGACADVAQATALGYYPTAGQLTPSCP